MIWFNVILGTILCVVGIYLVWSTYIAEKVRRREIQSLSNRIAVSLKNGTYDRSEIVRWQFRLTDLRSARLFHIHKWIAHFDSDMRHYEEIRNGATRANV